uniref:Pkinase_fungal domain-containing protein n=1 Tax=Globodera pallida TaxID=36090 RepID=A0A183C2C3_GLOPA
MPESILLGFPLPPSPTGTFPAQFVARDFASGSDVMDYRRPGETEADEGRVQEVVISGEFLCGRAQRFHPAAVYLREFFWESGVRDRSGTFKHPKLMKRIVGLYALRPTFGSFTFKIVRPAASYQVHNGDDSEPKIKWGRGAVRGGKEWAPKGEEGEWPVLEAEHSQFELVFDRGSCDSAHNNESEALSEGGLCLSEFARKPDWQDRKWRKALDSDRKCSTEILDRKRDRICVQRVGDVRSDADFVEKSLGPIRVDKCTVNERMSFEFSANFKYFDGAESFLPELQPHEQFFMRFCTAFAQFLPFCDVSPTNDGHTNALFPGLRRLFAVFLQFLAEAVPQTPMQNY